MIVICIRNVRFVEVSHMKKRILTVILLLLVVFVLGTLTFYTISKNDYPLDDNTYEFQPAFY
jgi:uncharacterized membrane protein SpoIIM required for sporulation